MKTLFNWMQSSLKRQILVPNQLVLILAFVAIWWVMTGKINDSFQQFQGKSTEQTKMMRAKTEKLVKKKTQNLQNATQKILQDTEAKVHEFGEKEVMNVFNSNLDIFNAMMEEFADRKEELNNAIKTVKEKARLDEKLMALKVAGTETFLNSTVLEEPLTEFAKENMEPVSTEMQRQAIAEKTVVSKLSKEDGKVMIHGVVPIILVEDRKGTNCANCHNLEVGTVMAVFDVKLDISELADNLAATIENVAEVGSKTLYGFGNDVTVLGKEQTEEMEKMTVMLQENMGNTLKVMAGLLIGVWVGLLLLSNFVLNRFFSEKVNNLIGIVEDITKENDLARKIDIQSRDEIGKLSDYFNTFIEKLRQIITDIANTSNMVASSATELSATAEQMSSTADNQVSQTSTLTTTSKEMASTITEVAKDSSTAASSSRSAMEKAHEGKEVIGKSQGIIAVLDENSKRIGEVINLIADIANKTDLLAINAAIEAANSGEKGKGFAVVADEVRKLAEGTTKATMEIADVIGTIQGNTREAIDSMEQAGSSMEEVTEEIESATKMIEQIATATEEQSAAINTFSETICVIADSSREVNSGTTETARAAEDLNRLSSDLKHTVERFKV